MVEALSAWQMEQEMSVSVGEAQGPEQESCCCPQLSGGRESFVGFPRVQVTGVAVARGSREMGFHFFALGS